MVSEAHRYFSEKINGKHNGELVDKLRILEIVEASLQVVMINLGDADDPYLIFESLNAKGAPLTQADLVRNYVLMKFRHSLDDGGDQERVYKRCWLPLEQEIGDSLPEFLRHYCLKDGIEVEKRNVYSAIKTLLSRSNDDLTLESELMEMARFGSYYAKFINPPSEDHVEVRSRLNAFVDLKVTTCYPLLLHLFDSRAKRNISDKDFKTCLILIESFVVRRAVCEIPTNTLSTIFMQLSKDYRDDTNVVEWLGTRMASNTGTARWPNDSTFRISFENSEQYGKKATRHVLLCIEKSFEHKEPVNLETTTIEHVMPQQLSSEWEQMLGSGSDEMHERLVHTFGNLTLTGYNSELGNDAFETKKAKLSTSHIELNRWICTQSRWNQGVITSRAKILSGVAAKLWPGPEAFV